MNNDDWMGLAAETSRHNPAARDENPDGLGDREIDRTYDWSRHVGTYEGTWFSLAVTPPTNEIHLGSELWTIGTQWWKLIEHDRIDPSTQLLDLVDALSLEQRIIYDEVMGHCRSRLAGGDPSPILMNVDGRAGTGKSFLISVLSSHLQQLTGSTRPILERCAPTGAAAFGINGSTLHSLLRLPVLKGAQTMEPLQSAALTALQAKLCFVEYIIIDEKSMISLATLHRVDARLQEAFPQSQHPFGGRSIILLGDFWQLPPVEDKALFTQIGRRGRLNPAPPGPPIEQSQPRHQHQQVHGDTYFGYQKYKLFTTTRELVTQHRQDRTQLAFASALEALRNNAVEEEHWATLSQRCAFNLAPNEIATFSDAVRIYSTNADVDGFNHDRLRDCRQAVIKVVASNSCPQAKGLDSDSAGGLAPGMCLPMVFVLAVHLIVNKNAALDLTIGCRLMILENFRTELGIVNGTHCILHDIVWSPGDDPRSQPPYCLLVAVAVAGYTGKAFAYTPGEQVPIVPIFRSSRDFLLKGQVQYRSQFAVKLAYAITIHKSQGMTLPRVALNLARGRKATDLFYVAVSRVKRLDDILFEEPFDLDRLQASGGDTAIDRMIDWDEREPARAEGRRLIADYQQQPTRLPSTPYRTATAFSGRTPLSSISSNLPRSRPIAVAKGRTPASSDRDENMFSDMSDAALLDSDNTFDDTLFSQDVLEHREDGVLFGFD